MRTDPAPRSSSLCKQGGMLLRSALAVLLLVGLAGCRRMSWDFAADCLAEQPGNLKCCRPGDHVDQGHCCPAGTHVVVDVEHEDWKICKFDEDPCADAGPDADACRDAGTDAEMDADVDAP